MIHECVKRNHNVAITSPKDLGILDSISIANRGIVKQGLKVSYSFNSYRKNYQRYTERGFTELLKFWQDGNDLVPIIVRTTSTGFYNTIVELIERKIVEKTQYIAHSFENPQTELNNQLLLHLKRP